MGTLVGDMMEDTYELYWHLVVLYVQLVRLGELGLRVVRGGQ